MPLFGKKSPKRPKSPPPVKHDELRGAMKPSASGSAISIQHTTDLEMLLLAAGSIDIRKNKMPTYDEWLRQIDISAAGTEATNSPKVGGKKPLLPPTKAGASPPVPPKTGVKRPGSPKTRAILPPGARQDMQRKSAAAHKQVMEQDSQINMISSMIAAYYQSSISEQLYILCNLYYSISNWLESAPKGSPGPVGGIVWLQQARRPAVQNLYMRVVCFLRWHFKLSSNSELPSSLTHFFGREMGAHGAGVDQYCGQKGILRYLTEAERDKFKIRFKDGLGYQLPWWIEEDPQNAEKFSGISLKQCLPVLAESSRTPGVDGSAVFAPPLPPKKGVSQVITDAPSMFIDDFSGCVMDMSWNLYCAPHYGGFDKGGSKKNFFHSSYMQGQPIAFAGSIRIQKGRVTGICNDSGHYRPTQHHMITVLQALQFHGVDLSYVDVIAMIVSKHGVDKTWVGRGDKVLFDRGSLNRLYDLDVAAQEHAYHKQKGEN
ncbi:hypothetical protein [Pelagibaculum spongiae]|uniref:Uncharacterized protein n=1 Tax=Pelagibaculum spongiae TaxID=2080658 RepID=A0A2V1GUL3_9GAMM|nr:hypothetical protein [Pelagibaculum spongiae]PVZ68337.1 hypothetical protein DC094_13715 [Pelagibaculum spongiae]